MACKTRQHHVDSSDYTLHIQLTPFLPVSRGVAIDFWEESGEFPSFLHRGTRFAGSRQGPLVF
jgi:hypothetical protein